MTVMEFASMLHQGSKASKITLANYSSSSGDGGGGVTLWGPMAHN